MRRIAEVLKKYSFHFPPMKRRYNKKHGGEPQQTKQTTDQPTNPFIKPTKQNNPLFFHATLCPELVMPYPLTIQFQNMTERLSKFRVRC